MAEHVWIKSELGHGETMCAKCMMTNREAAVLAQHECLLPSGANVIDPDDYGEAPHGPPQAEVKPR